jgi:hypothetical protein
LGPPLHASTGAPLNAGRSRRFRAFYSDDGFILRTLPAMSLPNSSVGSVVCRGKVPGALPAIAASTGAMGAFPLAIIPGFLVPLFVITHVIIYLQLRTHWRDRAQVQPLR